MKNLKRVLIAILVLDIAAYGIDNMDRYVDPLSLCVYVGIAISAALWLLLLRHARRSNDVPG
jgi:hypothetical protein